jgi:hypothetical protein
VIGGADRALLFETSTAAAEFDTGASTQIATRTARRRHRPTPIQVLPPAPIFAYPLTAKAQCAAVEHQGRANGCVAILRIGSTVELLSHRPIDDPKDS